jgi:transposase-like protein
MIKLIIYQIFNSILTAWAIKILSWEPPNQKQNPVTQKVIKRIAVPKTLQETLPPIQIHNLKPSLDYKQILKLHEDAGTPIKPVKHRKPIPKDTICPICNAPYEFIYSNAVISLTDDRGMVQKFKCKCCKHQWFPVKNRKHITLFCPYCAKRIDFKVHRKEFDKLKCVNPKCEYKLKTGFRYTYRDYSIAMDNIQQYVHAKINLSASHFSTASIAMALFFYPLLDMLPVHLSNVWVVDETYILYEGKWGYLFTVIDGEHGSIIAQIFSKTRSVASAYAVLEKASRRFNLDTCGTIKVVTDGLASYPLAIQLLQNKGQFQHCKVIGLKDRKVKNQYRRYKNLVENYYSVLKPYYYRTRGFGSFAGAVTFSILFTLYYNYLHPSDRFDDRPIIQIEGLNYSHPILSWKGLIEKANA